MFAEHYISSSSDGASTLRVTQSPDNTAAAPVLQQKYNQQLDAILREFMPNENQQPLEAHWQALVALYCLGTVVTCFPIPFFSIKGMQDFLQHCDPSMSIAQRHTLAFATGIPIGVLGFFCVFMFGARGNYFACKKWLQKDRTLEGLHKPYKRELFHFLIVGLPSASGVVNFLFQTAKAVQVDARYAAVLSPIALWYAGVNNHSLLEQLTNEFNRINGFLRFNAWLKRTLFHRWFTNIHEQYALRHHLNRATEKVLFAATSEDIDALYKLLYSSQDSNAPATQLAESLAYIDQHIRYPQAAVRRYRAFQALSVGLAVIGHLYYWQPGLAIGNTLWVHFAGFAAGSTVATVGSLVFASMLTAFNAGIGMIALMNVFKEILREGDKPGFKIYVLSGVAIALIPSFVSFLQALFLMGNPYLPIATLVVTLFLSAFAARDIMPMIFPYIPFVKYRAEPTLDSQQRSFVLQYFENLQLNFERFSQHVLKQLQEELQQTYRQRNVTHEWQRDDLDVNLRQDRQRMTQTLMAPIRRAYGFFKPDQPTTETGSLLVNEGAPATP